MSINTLDNKKLLWSTLQENKCFIGLPDDTFSPVKQHFEDLVLKNDNGLSSMVSKNKRVIASMIKYLNKIKSDGSINSPNSPIHKSYLK